MHDDLGWKNQTSRYILPHHRLYEWFSQFHSCGTYLGSFTKPLNYKPCLVRQCHCGATASVQNEPLALHLWGNDFPHINTDTHIQAYWCTNLTSPFKSCSDDSFVSCSVCLHHHTIDISSTFIQRAQGFVHVIALNKSISLTHLLTYLLTYTQQNRIDTDRLASTLTLHYDRDSKCSN